MKRSQQGLIEVFIALVITILACVFFYWVSSAKCENRARMMGFKHSYALVQGCMIEHQPGKWIPLENYRQF